MRPTSPLARLLTALLLTFIFPCIASADPANAAPPIRSDIGQSSEFSRSQIRALEQKTKSNPNDADTRALLLGYYFLHQNDPSTVEPRRAHILWLIANRPADHFAGEPYCQIEPAFDPDGFIAARNLWKQQTQKPNPSAQTLANAARFLSPHDPKSAEDLFERAETIDPDNSDWPQDRAVLLARELPGATAAEQRARTQLALAEYEKAYAISKTPEDKFYNLTLLPKAAFAAGDNTRAADYANQLLDQAKNFQNDWNYGNAIHAANVTLGQIALAIGDIETAKARLLDAGKTPGSPQLNSFGPNMQLAQQLLQKGQKETVLKYFDECAKFWSMGRPKLDAWRQTIKSGGIPDFSVNLLY